MMKDLEAEYLNTVKVEYVDQVENKTASVEFYKDIDAAFAAIKSFESKGKETAGYKYNIVNLPRGRETVSQFKLETCQSGAVYTLDPFQTSPSNMIMPFYICMEDANPKSIISKQAELKILEGDFQKPVKVAFTIYRPTPMGTMTEQTVNMVIDKELRETYAGPVCLMFWLLEYIDIYSSSMNSSVVYQHMLTKTREQMVNNSDDKDAEACSCGHDHDHDHKHKK